MVEGWLLRQTCDRRDTVRCTEELRWQCGLDFSCLQRNSSRWIKNEEYNDKSRRRVLSSERRWVVRSRRRVRALDRVIKSCRRRPLARPSLLCRRPDHRHRCSATMLWHAGGGRVKLKHALANDGSEQSSVVSRIRAGGTTALNQLHGRRGVRGATGWWRADATEGGSHARACDRGCGLHWLVRS
jgi:hypothetical protein